MGLEVEPQHQLRFARVAGIDEVEAVERRMPRNQFAARVP